MIKQIQRLLWLFGTCPKGTRGKPVSHPDHQGELLLDEYLDRLEAAGLSRREAKRQVLALKNDGSIRLCCALNMKYFKEKDVIFERNEIYFAMQIIDMML